MVVIIESGVSTNLGLDEIYRSTCREVTELVQQSYGQCVHTAERTYLSTY